MSETPKQREMRHALEAICRFYHHFGQQFYNADVVIETRQSAGCANCGELVPDMRIDDGEHLFCSVKCIHEYTLRDKDFQIDPSLIGAEKIKVEED